MRDTKQLTALFDACFRIQREAIEAAGHFIPLVVENVRGACPWVGRAGAKFGSYYLWGDIPALMPAPAQAIKTIGHVNKRDGHDHTRHLTNQAESDGVKQGGVRMCDCGHADASHCGGPEDPCSMCSCIRPVYRTANGFKNKDADGYERNHPAAFGWKSPRTSSGATNARKAASAAIAKIPFPLAVHIARVWKPIAAP